jgi:hypothetical protein
MKFLNETGSEKILDAKVSIFYLLHLPQLSPPPNPTFPS